MQRLHAGQETTRQLAKELDLLQALKAHLEDGKLAITYHTDDEDEQAWMAEYNLLTAKPVIFAANVSEDDLADDGASNAYVGRVREYAKETGQRGIRDLRTDRRRNFRTRRR